MIQATKYGMKHALNISRNQRTTCVHTKSTKVQSTGNQIRHCASVTIHADRCGSLKFLIFAGSKYFVTNKTNQQRYVCILLLMFRSDKKKHCHNYPSWIDRHSQQKLRRFHVENVLYFLSLQKKMDRLGVRSTTYSTYARPCNGVAKKIDRTPLEKTLAMLVETKINEKFYGKAVMHTACLHNRTISPTLRKQTSQEKRFGNTPSNSMLRFLVQQLMHLNVRKIEWDSFIRAQKLGLFELERGNFHDLYYQQPSCDNYKTRHSWWKEILRSKFLEQQQRADRREDR